MFFCIVCLEVKVGFITSDDILANGRYKDNTSENLNIHIEEIEGQKDSYFIQKKTENLRENVEVTLDTSTRERMARSISGQAQSDGKVDRIFFTNETHPDPVPANIDPVGSIRDTVLADFNNDGTDDACAVSMDSTFYFIDGTTGKTLYTNTEVTDFVEKLVTADFTGDGVTDVAAGFYNGNVSFIDGTTGETLYNNSDINSATKNFVVADINSDSTADVVKGCDNGTIHIINGATGETLHNFSAGSTIKNLFIANSTGSFNFIVIDDYTVHFINGTTEQEMYNSTGTSMISHAEVSDFNDDSVTDVVISRFNTSIYFVDGSNGNVMQELTGFANHITSFALVDLNNDTTPEVVGVDIDGTVYFINGTAGALFYGNNTDIVNFQDMISADFSGDGVPDIAIATWDNTIYFINGTTGETMHVFGTIDIISTLNSADFTGDGIFDILVGSDDAVYFINPEKVAPVLNYCSLPPVPTSEASIVFQIVYDETYLDTALLYYYNDSNDNYSVVLEPEKITGTKIDFKIPPVQVNPLKFWFWANDTWGNARSYGNETSYYEMPITVVDLYNNTFSNNIPHIATADFNNDSVIDIVAASGSNVLFIDGNGTSLYNNTDPSAAILVLSVADCNDDGIPDVVVGGNDNQVYFINGSSGETMYNTTTTGQVMALTLVDLNGDDWLEAVVASSNGAVYFINGSSGEIFYSSNLPAYNIRGLTAIELTGDNTLDIIAGDEMNHVYLINGSDGEVISARSLDSQVFVELALNFVSVISDFNKDGSDDAAVAYTADSATGSNRVHFIDGTTGDTLETVVMNNTITSMDSHDFNNDAVQDILVGMNGEPVKGGSISLIDGFTRDTLFLVSLDKEKGQITRVTTAQFTDHPVPAIIAFTENPTRIYIIDANTGGIIEEISPGFDYTSSSGADIKIADIDNNGIADIVIAGETHLAIFQPKYYLYNMFTEPVAQFLSASQGETVEFAVTIHDKNSWPVMGVETALLAHESRSDIFLSYFGVDHGNDTYTFSLNTAVWKTGTWKLYITTKHSFYNDIRITDYLDFNGNYINSLGTITNHGEINPDFTFSGDTGAFSQNTLEGVVESTTIHLKVAVEDNYYNKLTNDDVNVTVDFYGQEYLASFIKRGEFSLNISTYGMEYKKEKYSLAITINGPYFAAVSKTFHVEIIPQSPVVEFSQNFLIGSALISLLVFTLLLWGMRTVYRSLKSNPDIVLRVLRITLLLVSISFVLTLAAGYSVLSIDPMFTFLASLLAFGEIILLFFIWFFRHSYTRIIALKFSPLSWLPVGFFAILVAILISVNLLIATQIDWFNYKLYKNTTDIIFFNDVPKLFIDILITGFASGFLLVIITAVWETHSEINKLKMVKKKVEEGFYLKEPNKLFEEMGKEAASAFNSLLRSFTIWYVIIILTFFTVFEIYYFTPLLTAVLLPAVLVALIMLREPIIEAILIIAPMSRTYRTVMIKLAKNPRTFTSLIRKKHVFIAALTITYYTITVSIYLYLSPAFPLGDFLISISIVYVLVVIITTAIISVVKKRRSAL
jgi:hypothetical protein